MDLFIIVRILLIFGCSMWILSKIIDFLVEEVWRIIIPRYFPPEFPPTFIAIILLLVLKEIGYCIKRFHRKIEGLQEELREKELEEQGFKRQKKGLTRKVINGNKKS